MAHIPTVDIRQLGDISFDRQLELARQPNRDYDVDRWLFVPNTYTEYRYILGTRGKKPLICVGINPSTARPGALDPTLKSVERIARNNGFDSFIMFNVYAQRATSPDDMEHTCNPSCTGRICGPLPTFSPAHRIRWCGRPGGLSSRSGTTCGPACGI